MLAEVVLRGLRPLMGSTSPSEVSRAKTSRTAKTVLTSFSNSGDVVPTGSFLKANSGANQRRRAPESF